MQPSGKLHIGNYLGALKNWVSLQNSGNYQCYFIIVDLHAMTERFNPKTLPDLTKNLALDYLAAGIDPHRSTIFIQSHILEHPYLSWILATLTPLAELKRMHQFKDKSGDAKIINAGLFTYPILMAADILMYKADTIPVGDDQNQHVEITRVIAKKFNTAFGKTFPEPKILLTPTPRVMSLTEPESKMSKSKGEKHYIALADDPKTIREKIMGAVTDTTQACPRASSGDGTMSPGVANLFTLLQAFAREPKTYAELKTVYDDGKLRYSDLKQTLADEIIAVLSPIQEKRRELESRPEIVGEILSQGTRVAQNIAQKTLKEVREKTGLL